MNSTLIILIIISIPISWLETLAFKKAIKAWKRLESATYSEAGSPSEYLAWSNLKIKYGYILNFDYMRKINNNQLKNLMKKHHLLFVLEHMLILSFLLCAIYC